MQAVADRCHSDMQCGPARTNDGRRKKNIRKNEPDKLSSDVGLTVTASTVSTGKLSEEYADEVNYGDCAIEYVFQEETWSSINCQII